MGGKDCLKIFKLFNQPFQIFFKNESGVFEKSGITSHAFFNKQLWSGLSAISCLNF